MAHAILISIYHMLSRQEVYQDLGYGYLDQRKHKSVTNQLVRRLERLGYQVHLSMEATIPTTPVEPSTAPNALSVAFCASVKPVIPVMFIPS